MKPEIGDDSVDSHSRPVGWILTAVALGFFWLLIFNQQRLEWTVNATYAYGWAVPFLGGYLLWERWSNRPAPETPWPFTRIAVVGCFLLLFYLPVRVVQEANPDWVKINWIMAALCAALTLLFFCWNGGTRYGRYFIFPLLFCFTALPWPIWFETFLIQELTKINANACAETLTLFGLPALAKGNILLIGDVLVNVEEACSGIRSLQTAFMVSLFLGEFHSLRWPIRILLSSTSIAVALLINFFRTLLLCYLASNNKASEWHDTVGNVAMIVCLLGLWILAERFRVTFVRGEIISRSKIPAKIRPFPLWLSILCICWLPLVEVITTGWYDYHEQGRPSFNDWTVAWPEKKNRFRYGELAERTRALLKYDSGAIATWQTTEGYLWQMYYLRWNPGRVSKFLSSSHYPTVCLPATGMTLVSETGFWDCEIRDVPIPFKTYLFNQGGRNLYVFHAILEDRSITPGSHLNYGQAGSMERLRSCWRGERNLGQRVVGIAIVGPLSLSDAQAAVQKTLSEVVAHGPQSKSTL